MTTKKKIHPINAAGCKLKLLDSLARITTHFTFFIPFPSLAHVSSTNIITTLSPVLVCKMPFDAIKTKLDFFSRPNKNVI